MAQISMEIMRPPGSVLGGNQQSVSTFNVASNALLMRLFRKKT